MANEQSAKWSARYHAETDNGQRCSTVQGRVIAGHSYLPTTAHRNHKQPILVFSFRFNV